MNSFITENYTCNRCNSSHDTIYKCPNFHLVCKDCLSQSSFCNSCNKLYNKYEYQQTIQWSLLKYDNKKLSNKKYSSSDSKLDKYKYQYKTKSNDLFENPLYKHIYVTSLLRKRKRRNFNEMMNNESIYVNEGNNVFSMMNKILFCTENHSQWNKLNMSSRRDFINAPKKSIKYY